MSPSTPSLPSVAVDDTVPMVMDSPIPTLVIPKTGNYILWIEHAHNLDGKIVEMCRVETSNGVITAMVPVTQEEIDATKAIVLARSRKPSRSRETVELEEPDNTILNYIQTHKAADHKQIAKDLKLSIRTIKKALNRLRIHGHVNRTKTRS